MTMRGTRPARHSGLLLAAVLLSGTGMTGTAAAQAAAAQAAAAQAAAAQAGAPQAGPSQAKGPGVPASVITMPSAAAAPRAAINGPDGPPQFDPRLPRGTPGDIAEAELPSAPVVDFVAALNRAYWSHPALLAARARLRSTDYRLPLARSASGPQLNFEASYGFQRDNTESAPFPPFSPGGWAARNGWSSTATAVLSQPLFTFGRNAANEHQAMAQIAYQRAVLRSTEAEILYNAIRAYAGLLRDRSAISIYEEDIALLQREFFDNSARFSKREVTSTDVQQVESRVEQARAQLYAVLRNTANSEAAFLSAVGAPAGELAPPNPLTMPVATLEDAYAYAETHNGVIAAAYARERVSRAAANAARSAMLPRVDLRGRAEIGATSPYSDQYRQTQLRGEVVISGPIFGSGAARAQMQEAEAANDADWRLLDQALRENRTEVANSWNEWLTQTASIEPLRLASEAARKAYDGALIQEKAGFRTTLDVLSLERELLSARSSYNAATANAYIAQARLLASIGALEQRWLFPDAPAYDPDEHYNRTKNDGMIPVIVPLIRKLDGVFAGQRNDRPFRDPSAPLAPKGVELPIPDMSVVPPAVDALKPGAPEGGR